MQVLSWQHKRRRLITLLARLDTQVATRAHALEDSWIEKYRLAPHEAQPTPPMPVTPVDTGADATRAPTATAQSPARNASAASTPKPTAAVEPVPDYLL